MNISPEIIESFKEALTNPKKNNLNFIAINKFFVVSKTIIAKHVLADAYINEVKDFYKVPKVVLYIVMYEFFGMPDGKDDHGNLGYFLQPIKTA